MIKKTLAGQQLNWRDLNATRIIAATIGVILGIANINHGFFEALQGNKQTSGLIIQAIGESNRMWIHGTEEAFTLFPNFLLTGILAMSIGICNIIWSIGFIHKKYGRIIFLLLCILSFLVGGGIGQILFFLTAWAFATRMNKPLNGWKAIFPEGIRVILSKIWIFTLTTFALLFLFALEIAIFGIVPGMTDPETILHTCWIILIVSLFLMILTFVSGFAHDIERQKNRLSNAIPA
jgi:hypothetical protein